MPAANLLLEISAGAVSGCGFSLSSPMEGRQLPSEKAANGGIIFDKKDDFCSRPLFFSSSVEPE